MRGPALLLILSACARDPIDVPCPEVAIGELVVSEIRGDQDGSSDALGQWIELYNASSRRLDLTGLVIALRKIDGSSEARIVVRGQDLAVEGNQYLVLGAFSPLSLPAHVDYGFVEDLATLFPAGEIQILACGQIVDRAVYRALPGLGSWSLTGAAAPDSAANDDETAWCVDAEGTDHPGTPRERNHPCI